MHRRHQTRRAANLVTQSSDKERIISRLKQSLLLLPTVLLVVGLVILPAFASLYVSISEGKPKTQIMLQEVQQSVFGALSRRVVEQIEVPVLNSQGQQVLEWLPKGLDHFRKAYEVTASEQPRASASARRDLAQQTTQTPQHAAMAARLAAALRWSEQNPHLAAVVFSLAIAGITLPIALYIGYGMAQLALTSSPQVTSGVTMLALLPLVMTLTVGTEQLFAPNGNLSALPAFLGVPATMLEGVAGAWTAMAMLLLQMVWYSAPLMFVVFLVALRTLPRSTLDAAVIDGANAAQARRLVYYPHLSAFVALASAIHLLLINGDAQTFYLTDPFVKAIPSVQGLSMRLLLLSPEDAAAGYSLWAAASVCLSVFTLLLLLPALKQCWRFTPLHQYRHRYWQRAS